MNYLQQLPDNVNITVTKKDLLDLVNICLANSEYRQAKQIPEHLTIKQLSEYLNYSAPAIYRMVGQSEIPNYKLSGKLLFKKTEIDLWLNEFRQPTTKERFCELGNKCK